MVTMVMTIAMVTSELDLQKMKQDWWDNVSNKEKYREYCLQLS